jgi:hypothetical protein
MPFKQDCNSFSTDWLILGLKITVFWDVIVLVWQAGTPAPIYDCFTIFWCICFLAEEKISGVAEAGLNNKLQMMMTTMYTMRAAIGNLKDDCSTLKANITKLSNMTRY